MVFALVRGNNPEKFRVHESCLRNLCGFLAFCVEYFWNILPFQSLCFIIFLIPFSERVSSEAYQVNDILKRGLAVLDRKK